VPFAGRIGPGAKRSLVVRTPSSERPKVNLVAKPALPIELVRTIPAGLDGRALLRLANEAYYAVARGQQYARFLANPDTAGTATASFVYRTVAKAAPPAAVAPSQDGGGTSALELVLIVLATIVVLAGVVVLWAHL
jgi:hypothetical protein